MKDKMKEYEEFIVNKIEEGDRSEELFKYVIKMYCHFLNGDKIDVMRREAGRYKSRSLTGIV